MSLRLKFSGSIQRIVTDIYLSTEEHPPVMVRGLWDCGAMTCCIKRSLSDAMKLRVVGTAPDTVLIGSSPFDRDIVQIDVQVSDEIKFHDLQAVVLPDDEMVTGFIVGMNFITKGCLTIDGKIPGYTLFEFTR